MWLVAIILYSVGLKMSLDKFRKLGFGSHCLYQALGSQVVLKSDFLRMLQFLTEVQRAVSILFLKIHIVIVQPS